MRTPEEIKKGLEVCRADECHGQHTSCPYVDDELCMMHICGDALALIEYLDAKIPKWISIKEQLPEKLNENNQIYITEEVIGFDGECAYIGRYKVYKFDGHLTFFDGKYFRDDITHWMPLPEPPEER